MGRLIDFFYSGHFVDSVLGAFVLIYLDKSIVLPFLNLVLVRACLHSRLLFVLCSGNFVC